MDDSQTQYAGQQRPIATQKREIPSVQLKSTCVYLGVGCKDVNESQC